MSNGKYKKRIKRLIIMNQFFHSVLLAAALSAGGVCGAWAQSLKMIAAERTVLVDHKGTKFAVCVRFNYPEDNLQIRQILSERLFGDSTGNIESAFDGFLKRFEMSHTARDRKERSNYPDGELRLGAIFHGKPLEGERKSTSDAAAGFYKMADSYAPFYYYNYYYWPGKKNAVPESTLEIAGIKGEPKKGIFTYDIDAGRMLNVTDVFTEEAIGKLKIDGSAENVEVLVRPYSDAVDYSVMENGVKNIREFSITGNVDLFTDRIKRMAVEIEKKNRQIEEEERKEAEMRVAQMEKQHAEASLQARLEYQESDRSIKDLYLYMWDDTCYVSGVHKDIMTMTEEEIDRLASNKNCGYIGRDIRDAREFLKNGGNVERMIIDAVDPEVTCKMNGNAYPATMCDYAPIPPKDLKEYLKKPCSGTGSGDKSQLRYVIDADGNLRMPIIYHDDYLGKSAKLDKFFVSKMRALGKWIPGMKDGCHVGVVYSGYMSVYTSFSPYRPVPRPIRRYR